MLVRFKKIDGIKVLLFQCSNFNDDGSFHTRTLGTKNCEFYTVKQISEYVFEITPKVSYERFTPTKNHTEADLLKIRYFMGNDTKDIIKVINEKTFIIDDKIPVEYRVPTKKWPGGSAKKAKGRINDILKYKGLDHVDKPLDSIRYEGDCYSKIELLDDCRYELFKLEKVFQIK